MYKFCSINNLPNILETEIYIKKYKIILKWNYNIY